MTWGETVGVAGLVVTVVGFAITIWQLVRTARASEATQQAVERTERRMALNHLLVLLPQLRLIETDLDTAAQENDRKLAMRALVAYSHMASEIAGLLRGQDSVDDALVQRLEQSARAASLAKADLIDNANRMAKSATKEFRGELAHTGAYLGQLVGTFKLEAGRT